MRRSIPEAVVDPTLLAAAVLSSRREEGRKPLAAAAEGSQGAERPAHRQQECCWIFHVGSQKVGRTYFCDMAALD